jgi:hypothetical protein
MPAISRASRRAGLLLLASLCAAPIASGRGAEVDVATADQQQKAQSLYEQGVQHFKAGGFSEAADAFRKSYEVVASPNSHIMYARALRSAGKLGEAYEELALTQHEASELATRLPKYGSTAESAEAELLELNKRVAALSIRVAGDSSQVIVMVGARQVPHERWKNVAVEPGTVDVSARLAGGRRALQSVTAQIGELTPVELDLRQAEGGQATPTKQPEAVSGSADSELDSGATRNHPLRPWAFVAGGVGLVGLATFGVFGAMSRSTFSDLESTCPDGECPPGSQDDIDKGKNQQLIANIGLAVGVVGLGAGITLFIVDSGQSSASTPRHVAPRRGLPGVVVSAGPGSVSVRGTF